MILTSEERCFLQDTYRLSDKQLELLELMMEGCADNAELAKQSGLAFSTTKTYLHNLFRQMRVDNKLQAVLLAFQQTDAMLRARLARKNS